MIHCCVITDPGQAMYVAGGLTCAVYKNSAPSTGGRFLFALSCWG